MPVNRGGIALDRSLGQRAGALEVALAERFVGLLQQTERLGSESGGKGDQ